ncbi:carboxymuconolactone decarboxylase family protein [Aurantiacibacter sp. D1-12]|uniref:carboxymuconolactone decarboxylase family protein n=1 Tax=Aurantiacibacter sp. D1-12 TaxID=2993658 RepID=UPI00237CFC56|nr:peroxidase-related enzyme [Aurantiacibacter sp. D1-12]MDE1467365.1 peroxidase-related enzyme [Aurantiacibacter sp. D1-12]
MTFITTIPPADADGKLARLYDRVRGPDGDVDNILMAHSLRPASLEGHMALYKNVLHHNANQVPKWFLETIGVLVSLRNACDYCVEHHFAGLQRLLGDDAQAEAIRASLSADLTATQLLGEKELAALRYAEKLTQVPATVGESDIAALREAGWDDGEVLEINQVAAYFAYANRTVLGLGVAIDGETLGTSPSSDEEGDWGHR